MNKINSFIFDLDGVIVDTAKYHYLAWKKLAQELGFYFTLQDNEKLKGVSRIRSLEILLEIGNLGLDEKTRSELANKKNAWYVEYINKLQPEEILPGAKDFLCEAREKGFKTALGSASKNTPLIIERLRITNLFDVVVDGNSVSKTKPDPEVFLIGAKKLGVNAENCVVFEDAEAGVEAAKKAGMKAVGIGDRNVLSKADYIIQGFFGEEFVEMKNRFLYT